MNSADDILVTVFTASGQAMLDRAKKTLAAGGMQYTTRNERFPDIAFCGRMVSASGFTGPPKIQVQAKDETQARELLNAAGLQGDPPASLSPG